MSGCRQVFYGEWIQYPQLVHWSGNEGAYPGNKVTNLFQSQTQPNRGTLPNIDWKGFSAAFQSQPQKYRIIVTKYIHGWLPTGNCRKLIHNRDFSCPHCSLKATNEHLILCKHRKTEYTRNMYLTTMCSKMNTSKVGKDISQIWLDYLSHIINTSGQPFRLCCAPCTTERTKSILWRTIRLQDKLGVKLTPRGYLNEHWVSAVHSSRDKPSSPTPEECRQWSKLATNQIWSIVIRVWGERNESLHKEKIILLHTQK